MFRVERGGFLYPFWEYGLRRLPRRLVASWDGELWAYRVAGGERFGPAERLGTSTGSISCWHRCVLGQTMALRLRQRLVAHHRAEVLGLRFAGAG